MPPKKARETRTARESSALKIGVNGPKYDGVRLPPQNTDAERALLGALMLNGEAIYEIIDILTPDCFYYPSHAQIFDSMVYLHKKATPIDLVTLSARLAEIDKLTDVGGRAYLTELVNAAVSPGSAKHYADIVKSKFVLRRLIDSGYEIAELGFRDIQGDVEELVDEAERKVFDISNISASSRKFAAIKDELGEAWERLEQLQKRDDSLRGVPSGFPALDNMLSGFQESDLIILAARPSMGKTSLAMDIARLTATKYKNAVGIFSLEMSSQQLVDRMLAAEARVSSWRLRTGKIRTDEDFDNLQGAMERLSEAPIYIDDQPSATVLSMRSVARRLKIEKDLKLIIVDYLQLITPSIARSDNLVQQVTEISRSLKAMARELKVPVIALSQLSRAVEQRGGRPRLSDLRDSGSIEQDADVVMFIHRDDMMGNRASNEKTGVAEILIEKHRNGPVGKVDLRFDDEKTTFLPIEKADFGDFTPEAQVDSGAESAPF